MTEYFKGTRREVIGGMAGAAALAGTGLALPRRAFAMQDLPEDCAPVPTPGTPVPYVPNTSLPVRLRKSAWELSANEVDRLKAAYQALRQLTRNNPNDPRGWLRQANVHCWYCGGGGDKHAGEEIHGGWYFFPWHRAYLHFHERILCKLIGDDTFALPYWDWDSTGRQSFPDAFGDPNDPSNTLWDTNRGATANQPIDPSVVSAGILNATMNAPTNTLFMGESSGDNGTAGAMENAPHGPVHIWTGDPTLQTQAEDMGVLATAAQDPVFFAHHNNINRLWGVWLNLAQGNSNFTDPAWLNHGWQFYDENAVWTTITIAQVLDEANSLRSSYTPPSVAPIWIPTTRRAVRAPAGSLGAVAIPARRRTLAVTPANRSLGLRVAPLTRSVQVPAAHRKLFAQHADNQIGGLFVLRLKDIRVRHDQHAIFHVFVNLPSANARTSTNSPNFVGTVSFVAKSKRRSNHRHSAVDAAFDVSALVGRNPDASQLSVTLVPVAANGLPPRSTSATMGQITLEHR
jgi:polyphenol oxidase